MAFIGASILGLLVTIALSRSRSSVDRPPAHPIPAPKQVRVKVSDKVSPRPKADRIVANASAMVAAVCGFDDATTDRYEERNAALRSIARRRELPKDDVDALMAYVRATNDTLRVERTAALKNDVLNLLRSQEPVPSGLAEMLIGMFDSGGHPSAVLDYCIQHLGAMQNEVTDEPLRESIRSVFVSAAKRIDRPFAGTALYALADDRSATASQENRLRRLTVAACVTNANPIVRISAIQLAGQRGYGEVLPLLRKSLASPRRDAVADIVSIGTIGLLGGADDLPLLERLRANGGVRLRPAVDAAIGRIGRKGGDGK